VPVYAGDSFTFASAAPRKATTPPARAVSPFALAAAPPLPQTRPRPVAGELSHLFEGTARRGRPRGLSALSAPAIVSRPSTPGVCALQSPRSGLLSECLDAYPTILMVFLARL